MAIKNVFTKVVLFSVALVIFVAIMDFQKYPDSFWIYAGALSAVAAFVYYLFKKDKSEALAIFVGSNIVIHTGAEDLFFYIIKGGIPDSMDHLFNHLFIGNVAKVMGLNTVTPTSLLVSTLIGGLIAFFIVKKLKEARW